jgi:uncharacterized phage-associated protein
MASSAPYDSREIANLLLDLAEARQQAVTQLLLYKILYFTHGWYLAAYCKPLLAHDFEAWAHGPVIKVVRDEFKGFGDRPIIGRASKLDIYSGQRSVVVPKVSPEDAEFVARIFESYSKYGAWKLSEMTHEQDSPWDKIWNSQKPVGRLALRLRNEDIRAHFDGLSSRISIS